MRAVAVNHRALNVRSRLPVGVGEYDRSRRSARRCGLAVLGDGRSTAERPRGDLSVAVHPGSWHALFLEPELSVWTLVVSPLESR
jgi:hypothetical protein